MKMYLEVDNYDVDLPSYFANNGKTYGIPGNPPLLTKDEIVQGWTKENGKRLLGKHMQLVSKDEYDKLVKRTFATPKDNARRLKIAAIVMGAIIGHVGRREKEEIERDAEWARDCADALIKIMGEK